jgi:DNA-binding transcriptional LysR family regulator
MLKTESLRVFLAIARTQHIGEAAKALRLTPSATSHALAALEAKLGKQLFDRVGRNIVINADGRQFETSAFNIMLQLESLERDFERRTDLPRGLVRISATHSLATHWVAPAMGMLMARYADLSCDIIATSSREARERLEANDAEFAVTYDDATTSAQSVDIAGGAIVPVVRPGHPLLALSKKDRWDQLARFPAALPRSVANQKVDDPALAAILHGRGGRRLVFDSYEAAIQFMHRSDGWSFLPAWLTSTSMGDLAIVCEGMIKSGFQIRLLSSGKSHPVLAAALAAELRKLASTLGGGGRPGRRRV